MEEEGEQEEDVQKKKRSTGAGRITLYFLIKGGAPVQREMLLSRQ